MPSPLFLYHAILSSLEEALSTSTRQPNPARRKQGELEIFVQSAPTASKAIHSTTEVCGPHVDFATINVSSPNTEKLRDLQGRSALSALVAGVMETRDALERPIPIFLKVAPDLSDKDIEDICYVARMARIDAIIATNTTVKRDGLVSDDRDQMGGLSGAPLFELSTQILAKFAQMLDGEVPIIGVGGIADAQQAYTKIKAGASAVQIYSALIYGGFSMVNEIARELDVLIAADGYDNIAQAVGIEKDNYS